MHAHAPWGGCAWELVVVAGTLVVVCGLQQVSQQPIVLPGGACAVGLAEVSTTVIAHCNDPLWQRLHVAATKSLFVAWGCSSATFYGAVQLHHSEAVHLRPEAMASCSARPL